jgi:hypothetical protein
MAQFNKLKQIKRSSCKISQAKSTKIDEDVVA